MAEQALEKHRNRYNHFFDKMGKDERYGEAGEWYMENMEKAFNKVYNIAIKLLREQESFRKRMTEENAWSDSTESD